MMTDEELIAKIVSHGPQNGESDGRSILAAFDRGLLGGMCYGVEPFSLHSVQLQYDWLCRIREVLVRNAEQTEESK